MKASKPTSVQTAINVLCDPELSPNAYSASALCTLVCWMRWPDSPSIAEAMSKVLYIRFLASSIRDNGEMVSELTEVARETAFEFMNASVEVGLNIAYFDSGSDEIFYLAQVARFLVSYDSGMPDSKRQAASLGKAYYALSRGIYGVALKYSPAKRNSIWRDRKGTSAFVAADTLAYRKILQIDIHGKNLGRDMKSLLSTPGSLTRYFGLVKWTRAKLLGTLDKNALKGARFPGIPEHVRAVQLSATLTDQTQLDLMQGYRSNLNR